MAFSGGSALIDAIRASTGFRGETTGERFGTPFRGSASALDVFMKGFSKLRSQGALPPHLQHITSADIQNAFRGNASAPPILDDIIPPRPPPPVTAQQGRDAFLAQTPEGERLRRGLQANFQGRNLFGGNKSLLADAFRRGVPGVGSFTPPPPDPAQQARNRFLGPGGADLRSRLGQSFRQGVGPVAPAPIAPTVDPINPTFGSAQDAQNAFLGQNPLGNRLRRGLGANFQGQNLFGGGGQSRLREAFLGRLGGTQSAERPFAGDLEPFRNPPINPNGVGGGFSF